MLDKDTQTTLNFIPKNDLKKFVKKAFQHILYLKMIMFVLFLVMLEYNFYTEQQLFWVTFVVLFNIAFIQNMVNNLNSFINSYDNHTKLKVE